MLYVIQDKYESRMQYIATATTMQKVNELIKDLEEIDKQDNVYEPDRYLVRRKGICYSERAKTCGNCTNSICMLDHPETDCPAVEERTCKKE